MAKRGRKVQHRYTKQQLTLDQVVKTTASFALVFDALQEIVAEKTKLEKQVGKLTQERDELKAKLASVGPPLDQNQLRDMARDLAINTVREVMTGVTKDLRAVA